MDPKEFIEHLKTAKHPEKEALQYLAEPTQWKQQTDGTIRWGWFSSSPAEIAQAAMRVEKISGST